MDIDLNVLNDLTKVEKQVARSLNVNTVIYSINVQQKYVMRIRSI
jgi:hypothetical protein